MNTAAQTTSRPRVALWDNARFVLIVLVVIGHAISTVRMDSALGFGIYAYIYLFHMPAMILLSGIFAKAETSPKAIRSTLQLIIVWLLWEGIWALIHVSARGDTPDDGFLESPAWTLWFLVSLATMRILLPYLARLRYPLLTSVVIALVAGTLPAFGTEFSAARTLAFLPYFMLGWTLSQRGVLQRDWLQRPRKAVRVWGAAVLGVIALVFVLLPGLRDVWRIDRWLTWRDHTPWLFENAPVGDWAPTEWWAIAVGGIGVTLCLMIVAAAMTFALLLVTPNGHSRATVWGTRTLFVYLLHGPIIWAMRQTGIIDAIAGVGTLPGILLIIALSVLIALALSTRWVSRAFRIVIEPRIDWMLKPFTK